MNASTNTVRDSSDVLDGTVSGPIRRNGATIPVETNSSNLRWIFLYRTYLEDNKSLTEDTVDAHLRSVARMSAFLNRMPSENVSINDVRRFKDHLRRRREEEGEGQLQYSTVSHILGQCSGFYEWLGRRPGIRIDRDLPGYFSLTRKERAIEESAAKGTVLTFDQAICMFKAMPKKATIEKRNRAIIALLIVTGIRISALISLRGKHVNIRTRWINQDPREVDTKHSKLIRTYCLDLQHGLLDALEEWADWRDANGFGDDAPFFPPDRYIQPNAIGLGYKSAEEEGSDCWKSEHAAQRVIKNAAMAAGLQADRISSHDFRKVVHPLLEKRGEMEVAEEVALELNFGHTSEKIIRKNYSSMTDSERETVLDNLCRRALTNRTELEDYLDFERGLIGETDPGYQRAKATYMRNQPL